VWTGADREACLVTPARPHVGACWPFIRERFAYFVYGSYPLSERWRVDVFFLLLAFGVSWLLWLDAPRRDIAAAYFFIVLPVASYLLLSGSPALGLPKVATSSWGGMLVTLLVATVGIVASVPIGILLALGRRSHMPAVRLLSIGFIEFVRGVPLITVLFMASVMLPLFVPDSWSPDKLLRALVGIALFASAYMAEVVRAGLQAIPRGQYEAAMALGLRYWIMMTFVILPQALRITLPNIVNTAIGLFKDTTLVFIVGIFDLLRTIEVARIDPKWATPVTSATGYAFAALFYFVFCYGMSRYARNVEARLARSDRLSR
jgi:general L-amino acid transport system permease protein